MVGTTQIRKWKLEQKRWDFMHKWDELGRTFVGITSINISSRTHGPHTPTCCNIKMYITIYYYVWVHYTILNFSWNFFIFGWKGIWKEKEKNGKKSKINAILEHVYTYIWFATCIYKYMCMFLVIFTHGNYT
jgi:hypothetical protein